MATTTDTTSRTAHRLELMTKGDDAFNARDFEAVDAVHHPDMVAFITGLAEPVYGREAHAAAMQQFLRSTSTPRTPFSSEAATGSPSSRMPRGPSPAS